MKKRTWILAGAVAVVLSAPVQSQSAGGLADTYMALCGDAAAAATEACVALRQSMSPAAGSASESAVVSAPTRPVNEAVVAAVEATASRLPPLGDAAPNAEAWGPLTLLGGTHWLNPATGSVWSFRWVEPGEVIEWSGQHAKGLTTDRLALDATGLAVKSTGRLVDGSAAANPGYTITAPRPDVFVLTLQDWRQIQRVAGNRMVMQLQQLTNGQWTDSGAPDEFRRLSPTQAQAAVAALADYQAAEKAKRQALAAQNEARDAGVAKVWGILPKLAGTMWRKGSETWAFRWLKPEQQYQIMIYAPSGQYTWFVDLTRDRRDRLQAYGGAFQVPVLPDGSIFIDSSDDALVLRKSGELEWENGRMSGGAYARAGSQDPKWNGTLTKLSAEQAQAVTQQVARFKQQQAAAKAQSSGGGGDGLFGALLGAGMGAMMGGNTEQVMGAAIKGVQLVDPNSQVGQAFGSQADAMVSGQGLNANQMFADKMGLGGVTGGGVGGGGGSYPTKPNLATGSCPGFTEGNYRTVALSGGNDVQLKTMCGQAFEYYTMYKRAIGQGYSESDANRTYAAHEGAVANLRSFAGN